MSFTWTIKGVRGKDLTTEHNLHDQMIGFGPYGPGDTDAPYSTMEFRSTVKEWPYADRYKAAAQDLHRTLVAMAEANLRSLKRHHCETCTCKPTAPSGWSVDQCRRLISIPPEAVTKITCSY